MIGDLTKTPLHDWHADHGGRMVDFAGWSMPVQYTSIVEEHTATRTAVGLFDISHMGRFRFDGEGAGEFLDGLLTRRVAGMKTGQIRYSLVTNEGGGILDDVLVYRLESGGTVFHLLVVNASNREKIADWINSHLSNAADVQFSDQTYDTAMIAVQGPQALELAQPLVAAQLADMPYYHGATALVADRDGIASRTGYTGEDGCELIVPANMAVTVWERLIGSGAKAAGLGARDTLRLEAAMPLYGHELSEEINPFQAGLGFAVNLKDRDFPGHAALTRFKSDTTQQQRIGLAVSGRRVPREHYPILAGAEVVGEVTSGTFSPTLQQPIAMGYVRPGVTEVGTELAVDVRGQTVDATVVKMPFYTRSS